jgi:phage terminase large subunit-like protein
MAIAWPADFDWLVTPDPDPDTEAERLIELRLLLESMTPAERSTFWELTEEYRTPPEPWIPMPHQIPPPMSEDWSGFLLFGGRATGKTAVLTHMLDEHALGPACLPGNVPHRMGIIAPTLGDASASIVWGDDGLMVINPTVTEKTIKGGTQVRWPNGSIAYEFGVYTLTDVQRLRARTNRCFDVREEIAAWQWLKEGMAQADFGLRKGIHRWIGATTPKPRPTISALTTNRRVRVSFATTRQNTHLSKARVEELYETYGNTQLGLQELEGKILDKVSGALWEQELIDANRVIPGDVPKLIRVRTYVDPSWGTKGDEVGIIVAGLGYDHHVYILADLSRKATPSEWGLVAALGYKPKDRIDPLNPPEPRDWYGRRADRIVGEKNFQGEQVRLVMKLTAKDLSRRVLFSLTSASVSKRLRADPVVWLYERGRVHHVGHFAALEWELTSWVPPEAGPDAGDPGDPLPSAEGEQSSNWSPGRLDAVVFAATDLGLSAAGMRWRGNSPTTRPGVLEVAEPDLPAAKPAAPPIPRRPRPAAIPRRAER